ncbi:hypothetical protein STCU_00790 [Strigomonas culicis]|uniref:Uncharacterized protein n=1 Tax=Strigomonas culicis TaxID=28005 RepID=S9VG83_9TRYP|nr:hypothetical protein STCU_06358 [Strigomonas culicis]EPY36029.1 hypothetical protein STCU_00790 [Strigomonas culicis]|eukprot:EPY26026.1 hypothetical protein STCU_06358 [Strigomonas culicis]
MTDVRAFQEHQTRTALLAERERTLDARRFAVQELRQKVAQQAKENQARQEQLILERSRFSQKKAVQDEKVEAKEAHARSQQARVQQLAEEEDRLAATIAACEQAIQAATADLEHRQALEANLRDARGRMTQLKYQLEEKDGQVMKIETRLARMEMATEKRHTALAERLPEYWLPRVVEADAAAGLEGTAGESVLLVDEVTY